MGNHQLNAQQFRIKPQSSVDLSRLPTTEGDPTTKAEVKASTLDRVTELVELQNMLWAEHRQRVLVVIQAIDTGGKDGLIRSVFGPLNPQGVRIASFKVPTEPERERDYLWRVHQQVPSDGEIVVFNRSHYEDVLVVRVHELVPKKRWERRYDQINNFEQMLVEEGTTVLKFFLNISKDEQARRLQARIDDPAKRWKFSSGDLRERELWSEYQEAFEAMLSTTSTDHAPWHCIPSDRKWFRDAAVAEILRDALKGLDLAYPPGEPGIESIRIPGAHSNDADSSDSTSPDSASSEPGE